MDESLVNMTKEEIARKHVEDYLNGRDLDGLKARIVNRSTQGQEIRVHGETRVGKSSKMAEFRKNALAVALLIAMGAVTIKGASDMNALDTYHQVYAQETGESSHSDEMSWMEKVKQDAETLGQIKETKETLVQENPEDYFLGINVGAGPDENGNYRRLTDDAVRQVVSQNIDMDEANSKGGK